MIPQEETVSLLQQVLRTDTTNPPGNELEVARVLEGFFRENGIETEVDEFLSGVFPKSRGFVLRRASPCWQAPAP